jgi:hypothetical protein
MQLPAPIGAGMDTRCLSTLQTQELIAQSSLWKPEESFGTEGLRAQQIRQYGCTASNGGSRNWLTRHTSKVLWLW